VNSQPIDFVHHFEKCDSVTIDASEFKDDPPVDFERFFEAD
jgi:hypothetical protein